MSKFINVVVIETKMYLRTKIAVFFTFLFPFFLLFLFGLIWGKRYIPFLVPMLIAMVASSTAIYTIGPILPVYKEAGIFKRISVSPLRGWTYIYGLVSSRFIIVLAQSLILILASEIIYGIQIKGNLLFLMVSLIIGIFSILSIGGLIAGISKNMETATAIANITFVPLMFLSGAFIPIFILPNFLKKIASVSPVFHFIKILQDIIIFGKNWQDEGKSLLILIIFLILLSIITKKTFKEV